MLSRVLKGFKSPWHVLLLQVRAVFGKDPRKYSVMTTKFLGDDEGNVRGLITVDVELTPEGIKVTGCLHHPNLAWDD